MVEGDSYELLAEGSAQGIFLQGAVCGLLLGLATVAIVATLFGYAPRSTLPVAAGLEAGLMFFIALRWDSLRFQHRMTISFDRGEDESLG